MSASVLASSQGITSCSLSTDITDASPFAGGAIGGTWASTSYLGGCDGASFSTGGILSVVEPGLYQVDIQAQLIFPADTQSTGQNGDLRVYLLGSGSASGVQIIKAGGYADMPTGGVGVAQEVIVVGTGLLRVNTASSTAPAIYTPSLTLPTGCASAGGAGILSISSGGFTYINIRRVA